MTRRRILEDIRSATVFVKVVEAGSFRGGAAALGLSASVASHHISRLEAEVGTALLYRSTRKLALTPAGERLLASTRALVASTEQTLEDLTRSTASTSGVLRITLPTPLAVSPLMSGIWRFAEANAGVELSVNVCDTTEDLLEQGFDLAIRIGMPQPGVMRTLSFGTLQCRVITSPRYLERRSSPQGPADLESWRWVRHSGLSHKVALTHPEQGRHEIAFNDVVWSNAALGVLQLTIAGAGVATLPSTMCDAALKAGDLVEVLPAWKLPRPQVYAYWPASAPSRGLSRRLVDFLKTQAHKGVLLTPLADAA